MEPHAKTEAAREYQMVRDYLIRDNTVAAMAHLERALKLDDDPSWRSFLGYCIARERGQFRKGVELCESSLVAQKENPLHYLNLGKIYLLAGNKKDAIRTLRAGLAFGGNQEIERKLLELGARKPPLLRFLPRDSLINKYLGLSLGKIGLR